MSDVSGSGAVSEWQESPDGQSWAEALEDLDIAIAERRCEEAGQLLSEADAQCAQPQDIDLSDPNLQTRYQGLIDSR